jgi:hypothetical protein
MKTIPELHGEHREVIAAANQLIALISQETPPSMAALTETRWNLVTMFDRHLASEQLLVDQELGHSRDSIARSLARRYSSQMLDLRLSVSAHSGKWNNIIVQTDWAGYAAAVHTQFASAVKHMAWEERVIFPMIEIVRARQGKLRTG